MFLSKFCDNFCPLTRKAVTVLSPYRQCQRNLHPSQINPLKLKHLAKASLRGFRVLGFFRLFFFFLLSSSFFLVLLSFLFYFLSFLQNKTLCLGNWCIISSRPILQGSIILQSCTEYSHLLLHMPRTE